MKNTPVHTAKLRLLKAIGNIILGGIQMVLIAQVLRTKEGNNMSSEDRMLEESRCLCPDCQSEARMVDFPSEHKSNKFHGTWECVNEKCNWNMSIWE